MDVKCGLVQVKNREKIKDGSGWLVCCGARLGHVYYILRYRLLCLQTVDVGLREEGDSCL